MVARARFVLCLLLCLVLFGFAVGAQAQGNFRLLTVARGDNLLRTVDPGRGSTISSVPITLTGYTVVSGTGLAKDPTSGKLYALVQVQVQGQAASKVARLVTVDPDTGVATDIGFADDGSGLAFADIAVSNQGVVYGVTGSGSGSSPQTLFALDKTSGVAALLKVLGNGDSGEAIAFIPGESSLYHASAYWEYWEYTGNVFETVDPTEPANAEQPIEQSGDFPQGVTALTYFRGDYFLWTDYLGNLYLVDKHGSMRYLSSADHRVAGMAFIGTPTACPPALYAAAGNILYAIDPATGAAELIGPTVYISAMDFAPDATLYAVSSDPYTNIERLYTIDPCTGAPTEIGPTGRNVLEAGVIELSFHPKDGRLFALDQRGVWNTWTGELLTIDTTTGAATMVASLPSGLFGGLGFDLTGDNLYFTIIGDTAEQLFNFDLAGGSATLLGSLYLPSTNMGFGAIDVQPGTGTLFGVSDWGDFLLMTLDPVTRQATSVGATVPDLTALAFYSGTPPSQFTLTVLDGCRNDACGAFASSGTVTSASAEISCVSFPCSATLDKDAELVLTATAEAGSWFSGWSGACSGTGTCTVKMAAPRTVSARFERPHFRLDVSSSGDGGGTVTSDSGGVNCGSICSADYAANTQVTLTAVPAAGSYFVGWSGACSGSGTCTVTMDSAHSVSARFQTSVLLTLTLYAGDNGDGIGKGQVTSNPSGINCWTSMDPRTCTAIFTPGTVVTLTAMPDRSSRFGSWSGACTGVIGTTCTLTMNSDRLVQASFAPKGLWDVTVQRAGTGMGSISSNFGDVGSGGTVTFYEGETAVFTANAAIGSTFAGWSGWCSGTGTCSITGDAYASYSVTASFNALSDAVPPTVLITSPTNASTVSGSASISATANDNVGVAGVQFKLDGSNLGAEVTTAPYSLVWDTTKTANGSHTLTADARDAAGNHATMSVTVSVSNTATRMNLSNSSSAYGPAIAVDDSGQIINVVWGDSAAGNSSVFFSRSTDGGQNFSAPKDLFGAVPGLASPTLIVDRAGNINVLNGFLYTRSTDGGATFSTPRDLSSASGAPGGAQVAIDSQGRIYVIWTVNPGFLFTHSSDGGASFSAPVNIASGGSAGQLRLLVDSQDNINIAWIGCEYTACSVQKVNFRRSSDGGLNFTPQYVDGWDALDAQLAVDSRGNILLAWLDAEMLYEIYLSYSSDGGKNFSLPELYSSGTAGAPQLAVGRNDQVYVLWSNQDDGALWITNGLPCCPPWNSQQPVTTWGTIPNTPVVAADNAGRINLVWSDNGAVYLSRGAADLYSYFSQDFTAPENLSNSLGASSLGDAKLDNAGTLYVVWADNTPGAGGIRLLRRGAPATYALTVTTAGDGAGTVTSSPAGVDCASSCEQSFGAGTVVTLTATPAPGSTFAGWSGQCIEQLPCAATMNAPHSITATFTSNPPPDVDAPVVAITAPANASTISGAVGIFATATDTVGVVGVQFKLDGTALGAEVTTAPYSLVWSTTQVANGSHTLTADARDAAGNHSTASVTVTVNNPALSVTSPNGGESWQAGNTYAISWTSTGLTEVVINLQKGGVHLYNITDVPAGNAGSGSYQWAIPSNQTGGNDYRIQIVGIGSPASPIDTSDADFTITGPPPVRLTITRAGSGSGSVTSDPAGIDCGTTCSAPFANGAFVALTATPAGGSMFTGWSGACTGSGACYVAMSAAKAVTATFDLVPAGQFPLTVSRSGNGTVSSSPVGIDCGATCTAAFDPGTVVTLTASPASGSSFAGWSGNCTGTGTCSVTMDAGKNVTATFQVVPQSHIVWFQFDPPILKPEINSARLEVRISGTPTLVRLLLTAQTQGQIPSPPIDLHDDGTNGDRVAGDGIYSAVVPTGAVVQALQPDDAYRRFLGYTDVYDGATRTTRLNTFAEISTADIPAVPVTSAAADVQYTDTLVNIYDPQFFVDFDKTRVIKRFYEFFPDSFDTIGVLYYPSHPQNRYYSAVKNTIQGTGVGIIDNTASFGSAGNLLGTITFPTTDFYDGANRGYSHELGHRWINFLHFAPLQDAIPHWPYSTMGTGIMGISIPPTKQGGDYNCVLVPEAGGVRLNYPTETPGFTDLDLYLAGLLPADQVGEQLVFPDQLAAKSLPCNGTLYTGTMLKVTVADVIAALGPRVPDVASSPKVVRMANIVVSKDGLLDSDAMSFYSFFANRAEGTSPVAVHEGFSKFVSKPFYVATRGLGSLQVHLAPKTPPEDKTLPTVAITSHTTGTAVSGPSVALTASASDNVGVVAVQFKLDGVNLGAEDTTAPWTATWDTTRTSNGTHTLTVSARDAAGNLGASVAVTVTVNNSTEFGFTPAPGSSTTATVKAGGNATYVLNVAPSAGFTGAITFTCAGAPPPYHTCTVSPNPVNVSGTAATAVTVTVSTFTPLASNPSLISSAAPGTRTGPPRIPFALAVLMLPGVVTLVAGRNAPKRGRLVALSLMAVLSLGLLFACGGSGSQQVTTKDVTPPTPAGTYTITVTGTSGAASHTFNLTLTVN